MSYISKKFITAMQQLVTTAPQLDVNISTGEKGLNAFIVLNIELTEKLFDLYNVTATNSIKCTHAVKNV